MSATVHQLRPAVDLRKQDDDHPVTTPPESTGAGVAHDLDPAGTSKIARSRRKIAALEHTELPDFAGHTDPDIAQACLTCNPLHARAAAQAAKAARATPPATRAGLVHAGYSVAGMWRLGGAGWRWVVAEEFGKHLDTRPEMVREERKRRRAVAIGAALVTAGATDWLVVYSWPLAVVAAVVVFVVVGVAERRIRASYAPADAGRKALGKHPGAKAVRRVVAAAKLGKLDDVRVIGPVTRDGSAWTAVVEPPEGVTYQAAAKKVPELAAAIGVGLSQVAVDPVRGNNGRFALWVADADPLAGTPAKSPLLSMDRFDFWSDRVPMGWDVRGRPVDFSMVERTILIGGEPGGGKSVACADLLCALALDPHFGLQLVDGKQVELIEYESIAETLIARPDPQALLDFLCEQEQEIEDRYAAMKRARVKALTREIAADLGLFPKLLHIDELAYFTRSDLGDQITEKLRDRVSRGRAAMLLTSAATQRPSAKVVDTDLRDLISIRLAMRCTTNAASDMVLSQGWATNGYSAKDFDPTQRGAGLLLAEGTTPIAMRTNFLADKEITAILRRAYQLREQAGTLPKSDARPAVRLLKQVLGALREGPKTPTAEILDALGGEWTAETLADALRPLGVRPDDLWIDGKSQRGYRRADIERALDRA